jgi:hypothetical protein
MAITPITLQMTVPMTNDMAQMQNNENMRANTEHMQFASESQKQTQVKRETVIQKDGTDFPEYRYDAKEKGNNEYDGRGRKRRKSKASDDEEDSKEELKAGDITDKKEKKKHVVEIDIKL